MRGCQDRSAHSPTQLAATRSFTVSRLIFAPWYLCRCANRKELTKRQTWDETNYSINWIERTKTWAAFSQENYSLGWWKNLCQLIWPYWTLCCAAIPVTAAHRNEGWAGNVQSWEASTVHELAPWPGAMPYLHISICRDYVNSSYEDKAACAFSAACANTDMREESTSGC